MKSLRMKVRLTPMTLLSFTGIISVSAAFFVLLFLSAFGFAGDYTEKGSGNSGNNVLKGVTLDGSRQGQSVGFVDIDGDGIDDKIVGAPYASTYSNTGAVLVYKGSATGGFSSSPSIEVKRER